MFYPLKSHWNENFQSLLQQWYVFMISYYERNFIVKFLRENVFSNFCQNRNDAKQKSVIWPPFLNGNFFGGVCFCSNTVVFCV